MNRPAIAPANIRRASTRRQITRWWLERIGGALILMAIAFGIGTIQAGFEGHNPSTGQVAP